MQRRGHAGNVSKFLALEEQTEKVVYHGVGRRCLDDKNGGNATCGHHRADDREWNERKKAVSNGKLNDRHHQKRATGRITESKGNDHKEC